LDAAEVGESATYIREGNDDLDEDASATFEVEVIDHEVTDTLDSAGRDPDWDGDGDPTIDVDADDGYQFHVFTIKMNNVGDNPTDMRAEGGVRADGQTFAASFEDEDYAENIMWEQKDIDTAEKVNPGESSELTVV